MGQIIQKCARECMPFTRANTTSGGNTSCIGDVENQLLSGGNTSNNPKEEVPSTSGENRGENSGLFNHANWENSGLFDHANWMTSGGNTSCNPGMPPTSAIRYAASRYAASNENYAYSSDEDVSLCPINPSAIALGHVQCSSAKCCQCKKPSTPQNPLIRCWWCPDQVHWFCCRIFHDGPICPCCETEQEMCINNNAFAKIRLERSVRLALNVVVSARPYEAMVQLQEESVFLGGDRLTMRALRRTCKSMARVTPSLVPKMLFLNMSQELTLRQIYDLVSKQQIKTMTGANRYILCAQGYCALSPYWAEFETVREEVIASNFSKQYGAMVASDDDSDESEGLPFLLTQPFYRVQGPIDTTERENNLPMFWRRGLL